MRGIVVSYDGTPNTRKAYALVEEGEPEKFSYVLIGKRLGLITEIIRQNEIYGMLPSLAKVNVDELAAHLRAEEWHQTLVEIALLGEVGEGFRKGTTPPFPGEQVVDAPAEVVERALGADKDLFLGKGMGGFNVYLPLESFRKHIAILAMSGAGKSSLVKHLLLQLADMEQGPGVVVLDIHGEYGILKEGLEAKGTFGRVEVLPLDSVRIAFSHLTPNLLEALLPNVSDARLQLYESLLREARERGITTLEGFVEALKGKELGRHEKGGLKANVLATMLRELEWLHSKGIVGESDYPTFQGDVDLHRKMVVFDASSIGSSDELKGRAYLLLNRLFALRRGVGDRKGTIPPTVVFVEEAHNLFSDSSAARREGERIAREGRKFGLSLVLITQRPSYISQTVLSQCNTHILMRIMNVNDQAKVRESVEAASQDVLDALPGLDTGEGILLGEAVNFPVFFKAPKPQLPSAGESYKEMLRSYWQRWREKRGMTPSGEELVGGL